jgi:lipopolysaccharide transport system ATP-binding protein
MKPIIEINNLGKKYTIVHDKAPYGTFRDTLVNFAKNPFAPKQQHETFWALKDINLNIDRGDIVGIIGKNGAGKSTLLKIIAGITKPTEGNIKLYGRISSLLEVGTGFHPELTGRENIFLNGVILGMTRKEVAKKFDQIVDFAGIEKFLDTPVKHYSSGMYVRLAFAVAAHLEPDILIVDEVLAVGDAEFQKKCLGKMGEISKSEGRTIIFVSHNMQAVEQLCEKSILLDSGEVKTFGKTTDVVNQYLLQKRLQTVFKPSKTNKIRILDIKFKDSSGVVKTNFSIFEEMNIECLYESTDDFKNVSVAICFNSLTDELRIMSLWTSFIGNTFPVNRGQFKISFKLPSIRMIPGEYEVKSYIEEGGRKAENVDDIARVIINTTGFIGATFPNVSSGRYVENFNFKVIKNV